MEYREFVEQVKKEMQEILGADYTVREDTVMKNNRKPLDILSVMRTGENASPAINLELYYRKLLSGMEFQDVVMEMLEFYFEYRTESRIDMSFIFDFENIRDQVVFRLVSCDRNKCLLEHIPHRHFLDLVVIFCFYMEHEQLGSGYVRIQNVHLQMWGISEEDLFRTAICNMLFRMEYKMMALSDVLESMIGLRIDSEEEELPMYVLTNQERWYGAACMMFPHVLEAAAEKMQGDYYLLPSSVHECMILPVDHNSGMSVWALQRMVREINSAHVPQEEVLGDSIYRYYAEKKELRIITDEIPKEYQ